MSRIGRRLVRVRTICHSLRHHRQWQKSFVTIALGLTQSWESFPLRLKRFHLTEMEGVLNLAKMVGMVKSVEIHLWYSFFCKFYRNYNMWVKLFALVTYRPAGSGACLIFKLIVNILYVDVTTIKCLNTYF